MTQASMREVLAGIEGLTPHAVEALQKLTPAPYVGNAKDQAKGLEAVLASLYSE